jgi:hypothetical protein
MVVKEYKKNNPFINTDMAIIVTSYKGQLSFLKYALQRAMETEKYVICSYDRRHGEIIPADIMDIPHAWVFKHETFGAEKRNGWLWDIIYAANIIGTFKNIKYVFTTNGDCIWDKPQNMDKIVELLGDADLMSASSNSTVHTCNKIWKLKAFKEFVSWIILNLSNNIPESYSPEVLLRDFILRTSLKLKTVPEQPRYPMGHFYEDKIDHYSSYHQDCTWKDILGYRNLGGEHKAACQEHLEPVPVKYFDLRNDGEFLNKHERETLYFYLMSGDRRYLYKYWTEGEDSSFNRRYFPLEYYGSESLIDDSKRKEFGPYSERTGFFDRWKYDSYIIKDDEYYTKWKVFIEERGYINE